MLFTRTTGIGQDRPRSLWSLLPADSLYLTLHSRGNAINKPIANWDHVLANLSYYNWLKQGSMRANGRLPHTKQKEILKRNPPCHAGEGPSEAVCSCSCVISRSASPADLPVKRKSALGYITWSNESLTFPVSWGQSDIVNLRCFTMFVLLASIMSWRSGASFLRVCTSGINAMVFKHWAFILWHARETGSPTFPSHLQSRITTSKK